MSKIVIFAGTSDGRRLAERLAGRGAELVVSVATDYGAELMAPAEGVRVHAGRMDEAAMERFLADERFDLVADATHPYADLVTENLRRACERTGTAYLRVLRPAGASDGDGLRAADTAACAELLKTTEGNVFLTTGSKELPVFCADPALRERLYARVLPMRASLDICERCGLKPDRILAAQGPFDEEMNYAMLRFTRAEWMVTKDTGDAGGYAAKLRAAARAGVKTVVIGRPTRETGLTVEEAAREIAERFRLKPEACSEETVGADTAAATEAASNAVQRADAAEPAARNLAAASTAAGEAVRGAEKSGRAETAAERAAGASSATEAASNAVQSPEAAEPAARNLAAASTAAGESICGAGQPSVCDEAAAAIGANAACAVLSDAQTRPAAPSSEHLRQPAASSASPIPLSAKRVVLAGIGMGGADSLTGGAARAVREAQCVVGAKRMLETADCAGKIVRAAIAPDDIARVIREENAERFAVLFSGDTGFYSGAKKLIAALDGVQIEVLPGVGSLQALCAKLRRPWENVRAVSLHGRDCNFAAEVRAHEAVFALLGGRDGAKDALDRLCRAGLGDLTVHIGQRLGYPDEKLVSGTADALREGAFDPLSVLLVENPGWKNEIVTPGLPDEAFDRDETPMTKSEVRAVSLGKLALTPGAVVYDVGSGSGSVSVECARLAPMGHVYAVERKPGAAALTRHNAEKFGLENLTTVEGLAPEAFADLPAPTHAFLGGTAGNLDAILDALLAKNPHVRIVANAVTLETVAQLTRAAKRFTVSDIAEISVAKPRRVGGYSLMTAQNPVYVFTMQNP